MLADLMWRHLGPLLDEAAGYDWLVVSADLQQHGGLARLSVAMRARRAPGHISPLEVQIEATDRNPRVVEDLVLGAVRRLGRPEDPS